MVNFRLGANEKPIPADDSDVVRVFVGTDRSQLLAVSVLAHSIRRHTALPVEVRPMHDLDLPSPRDPRQSQRTGFSFTRFAVPRLRGYQGRALYLDADMLVLRDIGELWDRGHRVGAMIGLTASVQS